jgi:anti-sigma B factor antagonist
MKVEVSRQNNVSTVSLEGSIDGKTAPLVREELRPTLEKAENVILDMSKVDYLSSAGLRLLLLIYREFTAKNGKLVLMGLSPDIQAVMSHTGFLSFFTLAESEQEALRAFA